MKFKIFSISIIMLLVSATISAQNYKTGVGARVGFFNGLTVKNFISNNNALEGLLNFRWDGVIVTGLYEWQYPVVNTPGLDYYAGVGGHIGFFNDDSHHHAGGSSIIGVDLIIGLEYTFREAPISLGLDYKPAFNFNSDKQFWGDGLALSLRFNIR